MKDEKEVFLLVKLRRCNKFQKVGFFGKNIIGGCKSNFEKVLKIPEKNKEFRKFFDELVGDGVLEFFEKRKIVGGFVDTYVINKSKIMKKIRSIKCGKEFYEECIDDYTSF